MGTHYCCCCRSALTVALRQTCLRKVNCLDEDVVVVTVVVVVVDDTDENDELNLSLTAAS